jgi:carbon catabolite-derepressing protein kinase
LIRPKAPIWHFGIRSVSPPMEVMHELYKSLDNLGIEWREKRGEWGARVDCCDGGADGGIHMTNGRHQRTRGPTERDFRNASKDDLDIYTIEIRWRKRDLVVSACPSSPQHSLPRQSS